MVKAVLSAGAIVIAVHGVTYALVRALPDAAVAALGFLGGNAAAVSAFWEGRRPEPYPQHLLNALGGDFGATINGVPVAEELLRAVNESLPMLLIAIAIAVLLAVASLGRSKVGTSRGQVSFFDFLNFIPPFFVPFVAAAAIFASVWAGNAALLESALFLSLMLPVYFMLGSVLLRLRNDEEQRRYPAALLANGITASAVGHRVLSVAIFRLTGLFDRAVVVGLSCLMLAEPTLGLPGLGSLAARAVRTADPNLIIGVTVATALIALSLGIIVAWAGKLYGIWAGRSP